jgi:hypothetical protein
MAHDIDHLTFDQKLAYLLGLIERDKRTAWWYGAAIGFIAGMLCAALLT